MTARRFVVGTSAPAAGLALLEHDTAGHVLRATPLARASSPSFVALGAGGHTVYCVEERERGAVCALHWTSAGRTALRIVSRRSTHGAEPCHLLVHPDGLLVTANYAGASIAVHPLDAHGAIGPARAVHAFQGHGPHAGRQDCAHPHMIAASGRDLAVADLGSDAVWHMRLAPHGAVTAVGRAAMPAGSGPRQVALDAGAGRALVLGELDNSVTVTPWPPPAAAGVPRSVAGAASPLPDGTLSAALVPATRPGRYWASHRGADVVTELELGGDGVRALRELPSGGRWPRHLAAVGEHLYVANQLSDEITCLDARDGTVVARATTPAPTCVVPLPDAG